MKNLLCLFLCFVVTNFASGDMVVYDNGAGGSGGIDNAFRSDADFGWIRADDVTLGSSATITGIEWTGIYGFFNTPPATDDFTIDIYGDNGGAPLGGAPLASFNVGDQVNRVDSGFFLSGFLNVYEFSADINFAMDAGTTYWVSIYANTAGEDDTFFWGSLAAQGNSYLTFDSGLNWDARDERHDFRLIGVPEPSSAIIGLIGLAGLIGRRRR